MITFFIIYWKNILRRFLFMPNSLNLTGQQFGEWTVINQVVDSRPGTYWLCECSCGTRRIVAGTNLKRGKTKSCGGCKTRDNLLGRTFGRLTVIARDTTSHSSGHAYWICECECGNQKSISAKHLKDGSTKSCGCLLKERGAKMCRAKFNDLTNQQFGQLIVHSRYINDADKHTYWNCECSCGNQCIVRADYLLSHQKTANCGCLTGSQGELLIARLLQEYKIPFEREKTFDDCINPKTGKKLRFDFFVDNKYLIEFDGAQHFLDVGIFNSLNDIQERDQIKNIWAKSHNIPLIRIPYTELNTLTYEKIRLH